MRRLKRVLFPVENSSDPYVSVVIPAMNERKTIVDVIWQARLVHDKCEVIVVVNGSRDGTGDIARKMGARVLEFKDPLGHDVGRAIGAMAAKGEIIVFIDGDFIIPAKYLRRFVMAIENGVDVALNRYVGPVWRRHVHSVILAKHALNVAMNAASLFGCSLTTVPHALSRKALATIGAHHLAVPPKALAIAIKHGLCVKPVAFIDVGRKNPRKRKKYGIDPLEHLIVGDHLEALHWFLQQTNERGIWPDLGRRREYVR